MFYRVPDRGVFELLEAGHAIIAPAVGAAGDPARAGDLMTGAAVVVALAVVAWAEHSVWRRTFVPGLWTQAVGALVLAATGFWALAAAGSAARRLRAASSHAGVDGLTAFFLGTLGVVAAPSLAFSSYLRPDARGRAVAALTGAFVLVLAGVLCARDPLSFLAFWEVMTLLPAVVILVAHGASRAWRRIVFTYVAITHLGGVGTWVAILLLAEAEGDRRPTAISTGSGTQVAVALAALVGMGTKAGVVLFTYGSRVRIRSRLRRCRR